MKKLSLVLLTFLSTSIFIGSKQAQHDSLESKIIPLKPNNSKGVANAPKCNKASLPNFFSVTQARDLVRIGRNNDGGYLISESDIEKSDLLICRGSCRLQITT